MATTRTKKESTLKELREKFEKAQSVAFGQYAGLTVEQVSKLRKELRAAGVEFKVAKRTLFKIAAKEQGFELPDEIMEGTVGAAFSYEDSVAGPRLLKKLGKDFEKLQLMGGIMEGKVMTVAQMKEIAGLPSKQELLAKFVGLMRAPLQGFYGAIQSPLGSFVRAASQYAEKKPA
ncbi:50S ribosomal protein L10 [Candidatus Peregrinibacteria bacterium]|nr:MAG: 50S ribosomal protein L10 [Candidatus Peregrinibacteria bacterium]